jgi:hypothetical protein
MCVWGADVVMGLALSPVLVQELHGESLGVALLHKLGTYSPQR